jgi:hypothetical protein
MDKRAYTIMRNKAYQTLESIGTIMWLLVDFIWMCGFNVIALLIGIPTAIFLIGSCIFYSGNKKSERYVLIASAGWFLMNSVWIMSELGHKDIYLWIAKLFFIIACFFVYLSLRASKKEGGPTDFKRLKIK